MNQAILTFVLVHDDAINAAVRRIFSRAKLNYEIVESRNQKIQCYVVRSVRPEVLQKVCHVRMVLGTVTFFVPEELLSRVYAGRAWLDDLLSHADFEVFRPSLILALAKGGTSDDGDLRLLATVIYEAENRAGTLFAHLANMAILHLLRQASSPSK